MTYAAIAIGTLLSAAVVGPSVDSLPGSETDGYGVEAVLEDARDSSAPGAQPGVEREFLRAEACDGSTPVTENDNCSPLASSGVVCAEGMTPVAPLWVREVLPDGTWSRWSLANWYSCPSEADLQALIEREWTQLRPASPAMTLQPGTGTVLATVPTIAFADPSPRLHSATLLGANVEIRATPALYTWTWGDGEETTTSDPGAPYPDATITHAYAAGVDAATVTLTTTWSGEYRVGHGTWNAFDTTIPTTSPGLTLEVVHPRARLVDGSLD